MATVEVDTATPVLQENETPDVTKAAEVTTESAAPEPVAEEAPIEVPATKESAAAAADTDTPVEVETKEVAEEPKAEEPAGEAPQVTPDDTVTEEAKEETKDVIEDTLAGEGDAPPANEEAKPVEAAEEAAATSEVSKTTEA